MMVEYCHQKTHHVNFNKRKRTRKKATFWSYFPLCIIQAAFVGKKIIEFVKKLLILVLHMYVKKEKYTSRIYRECWAILHYQAMLTFWTNWSFFGPVWVRWGTSHKSCFLHPSQLIHSEHMTPSPSELVVAET